MCLQAIGRFFDVAFGSFRTTYALDVLVADGALFEFKRLKALSIATGRSCSTICCCAIHYFAIRSIGKKMEGKKMKTTEKKREYEPPQHRGLLVVLAVLRRTGMHP